MGMLDIFKKKETKQQMRYAQTLSSNIPIFSQFGNDIYASDVVQQAMYTIVTEMSKLAPRHIRTKGFDPVPAENSNVQWILDNPNYIMTTSEFIEKFMWNLLLHYNSFIYMEYEATNTLVGLYPLSPINVTFLEDGQGNLYTKLLFKSGYESTLPYSSLIHLRSHYSMNDLMGGNELGKPDHQPLLKTLQLNDILLQGVKKALNASFAINGIVQYKTMMDDGTMEKSIKEFNDKLHKNESGILGIDNKSDFIQLKRDLSIIDEATLKFIDDKILRNFGTPIEIVRGNYTAAQYEAFYQKTLEHFVISISQSFTKRIFTDREKGFKNEIKLYPKELSFMNSAQTLAMVNLLGQSGALYENEKRTAFGYAPLPELNGVRQKSLNYVSVDIADKYQLGKNFDKEKNTEPVTESGGGDSDG